MITVIQAHPVPESFNAALLDAIRDGLSTRTEPIIYQLGEGNEPGPTADDLAGTTELWFVYPTWWGGQPAVLLDWLQRTLGPWIDGGAEGPSPLWTTRRLVAVTTHGSPPFANKLQGEAGRQFLSRTVLSLCSPTAEFEWLAFFGIDWREDSERKEFLDEVRSRATSAPVAT